MTNPVPAPNPTVSRTRPFTSEEYFESLRDGREIWIYGERVKDVTTHPAFRNTVRMIGASVRRAARPSARDVLCTETDTGSGGYTHRFYKAPRSARRIGCVARRDRRVGAGHLRLDGPESGLQSGVPRHARRQPRLLYAIPGKRAALVQEVQEEVTFVNHAIVNPPVDRNKPLDEVGTFTCTSKRRPTAGSSSAARRSSPRRRL